MKGAEHLVNVLSQAGVKKIFALSGNQIMPVFDACIDADIEIVHTRHEGAAVYMAEAYAQMTGNIGVALVTAGAGIANAMGAIFSCGLSDTPVLILSGDSPVKQDGTGAFQEMDQVAMTSPLTRFSARPKTPAELVGTTRRAIRTAMTGQPGPVHISLADDVLREPADNAVSANETTGSARNEPLTQSQIEQIQKSLDNAERPLIVLGPALNATRMPDAVPALENALGAPVIIMESPRGMNDPSRGNLKSVFSDADLVIAIGKPVDFTLGFGKATSAKWIVVNGSEKEMHQAQRNLGDKLIAAIKADAAACAAMLGKVSYSANGSGPWHKKVASALANAYLKSTESSSSKRITSRDLCAAVEKKMASLNHSVLICDGGEFGQWAQAITGWKQRIVNGVSGAIGGSIGYAIGAKASEPEANVFALMGDGTAGFHFMEFETAARAKLPFVVVIGNDLKWNAEHQIQLRDYGADRLNGCDLSEARYDKAAIALGCHGEYVTEHGQLDAALDRAFASGKPACVNVMIEGLPAPGGGH